MTLALLALVASSCGFSGDLRGGRRVLVMNNMAEPASLDPALQSTVEEQRLTLGLFEGLMSHDPVTLRPIPGVARSVTVTDDDRLHTFHLRECRWSNGDPVTAEDFVYAWRRVLAAPTDDPARRPPGQRRLIACPCADLLDCIAGAADFRSGRSNDIGAFAVRAVDPRTLEVRLSRRTPWFHELLCFPTFMPVHPPTVEAHAEAWTRPEHFVGNGPFVLSERRLGESIGVVRNPNYWEAGAVDLDGLVYLSTDQVDTALDQYLAGESDWVRGFDPRKARAWRADPGLSLALAAPEYLGTWFLRANCRKAPFDDPRLRRALALALDRESICLHVTGMGERAASGLVPAVLSRFMTWEPLGGAGGREAGLDYSPEEARRELAAAGFPGGRGLRPITLAFNSDVKNRSIAEAIQAMWKTELGVDLRLLNREKRVHTAAERSGDYELSRGSWVGDFHDPSTFLDIMRSNSGNNRTGWKDPAYDEMLDRAAVAADPAERRRLLQAAERRLMVEEAPLIALFGLTTSFVLRPGRFAGIHENARDLHPPKWIRMLD